jgi:hypothetical protein
MSDYTKTTDFAAKDGYASGNPSKAVVGTEIDDEFNNIATHMATKYDSTDIADEATAEALTSDGTLLTPLKLGNVFDHNDGVLRQLFDFASTPVTDGLIGWDASAAANSEITYFTAGVGLEFNGTTIEVVDGLDEIVSLTPTDGNFIVGNGTEWVAESGAVVRGSLGLVIGTDVQAQSVMLDDLSGLGAVAGADYLMVSTAAGTWALENGNTMRTSLGLGTGNSPQFTAVNLGSATATTISGSAGQVLVEGRAMLQHSSASYTSGKITFGTAAATGGASGDIHFEYTV